MDEIALLQFSAPVSDSESMSLMTTLDDGIELPKRKSKAKKKKCPVPILARTASMPVTPVKQIGTISLDERRKKIKRFLEKRQRRSWTKKISYDCRKRVADNRLRVKGRFVTKTQAISCLGMDHESVQKLFLQEKTELDK